MQETLHNKQLIDYLAQTNLKVDGESPEISNVVQSEEFRRIISEPKLSQAEINLLVTMILQGLSKLVSS